MPRPSRFARGDVVACALRLADAGGLGAVTMAGVAAALQVTPMALYAHVESKEHLLDLLVEAVLLEVGAEDGAQDGWARLDSLARSLRTAAGRHPAVFPLLLQRPATGEAGLAVRARIREALVGAGVAPDASARWERLLSTIALGFIASEAGGRFAGVPDADRDADFDSLLELVRRGVPAGQGDAGSAQPTVP
jgi:AcrR family transcriptional regulator